MYVDCCSVVAVENVLFSITCVSVQDLTVCTTWCRAPCISPKIVIDGNFMSLKQQIFAFSWYHFDFTFNFNYCTCHNRCMLYGIHDVSMKAAIHLIFFLPGSPVLLS